MYPLRFVRSAPLVLLCGCLSFASLRIVQMARYGDTSLFFQHELDVLHALWTGGRFDLKMLSSGILLLLVPAHSIAMVPPLRRFGAVAERGAIVTLLFCVNFAAACQLYYYDFYKTPFSPMVFGLVEDDTWGILAAAWSQYPVVGATSVVVTATALQAWLAIRCSRPPHAGVKCAEQPARERRALSLKTLAMLLALVVLARGSLGAVPLRDRDATISANPLINDAVRNAWQTLYAANNDRRDQVAIKTDPARNLAAYGFSSTDDLAGALGAASGSLRDLEAAVFRRTSHNAFLDKHPPHVVFALMESWGAHPLAFDTAENDLTGAMAEHLMSDFLFNNFFPAQLGTHSTLEALLLNSPLTPLTQGDQGLRSYPASAVKPFKMKGYRTIFLYGGSRAWRALGRAMKCQYFDEVYDMADIMARYPDAQRNVWGVFDEYLFRFAFDLLATGDAAGQKLFIFLLTTTNHPPHSVPDHYVPHPLDLTDMRRHFALDFDRTRRMMRSYQYATDRLGVFIDWIETAPFGNKTVITATGAHNMHALIHYRRPADSKDLYRVPGFFRVPPRYWPAFSPDLNRYAGHGDIFPSLYNLALSDAVYPAFGHNLFGPAPASEQFAVVAFDSMFSRQGALLPLMGSSPVAFRWRIASSTLEYDPAPSALLTDQARRARARVALADWYTRYQVIRARSGAGD
jgi:phosphoglycerol transferase MdoB-like AlkP superfamily enzyme